MQFINETISNLGALAPYACILLFLLASLLVVWRLEVLSGQTMFGQAVSAQLSTESTAVNRGLLRTEDDPGHLALLAGAEQDFLGAYRHWKDGVTCGVTAGSIPIQTCSSPPRRPS